jgi:hypothetical protein
VAGRNTVGFYYSCSSKLLLSVADRGSGACNEQAEGGDADAVFLLKVMIYSSYRLPDSFVE